MAFLSELVRFLFSRRSRMVLIPFVLVLLVFAVVFVVAQGTAWAPFVYAVF
ncbi:hypothetical protein GCM10011505_43290 [Tistrella bauzanensis]|uniref:ABC transporter permease n=1 Tax=Tistrella bauzanensis TaxID=657419 RepID=A0ABQ1J1E1_9PROT|nr:DUF5989 family protein [Tistrella bauzanensis]GGB57762.1 hypothetical protein GCM10011505_43290 [Tistrella bauzanensis]